MIPFITIALIILAGGFKAVADTLFHHFDTSVFKKMDRRFWDPNISWDYVNFLPGTKYRLDGWHIANTGMIVCFCFAIVLHHNVLPWGWEFLISGAVYNLSFNLFYNKILR